MRQTALLLALFCAISLAGWGGTYWLVRSEMMRMVDNRLEMRMAEAAAAVAQGAPLPEPAIGQTASFVTIDRPDGFSTRDLGRGGRETRFLLRTVGGRQILLTEDIEAQEELRDILEAGVQLSFLATLVATLLAGAWMAQRGQRRLNTLSQGLARVANGKLDQPIELDGNDDLALLAGRINLSSERLNAAMMQIRVQSSNIAHDLRTPLARLRAALETSLIEAEEKGQAISPDVLEEALDQIDRITGTFEALLRLSRIESGAGRAAFQRLDLAQIVEDVRNAFGPVVEDEGQALEIRVRDVEPIKGDRDMLVQLIANLIQNALRYGAPDQTIRLQLHGRRLVLSDEGPGIPFEDREKVLQPLYQGEATRQGAGFGLGLSLVRAICELHGAELVLSDGPNGKGLTVTVSFPSLTDL